MSLTMAKRSFSKTRCTKDQSRSMMSLGCLSVLFIVSTEQNYEGIN
jgi:hypothetical protein